MFLRCLVDRLEQRFAPPGEDSVEELDSVVEVVVDGPDGDPGPLRYGLKARVGDSILAGHLLGGFEYGVPRRLTQFESEGRHPHEPR